jgi:SulP family sulfate permease
MTGIFTIIAACSFASLIFSGPLEPFVGNGVWLMLWTGLVSGVLVALTSSLRGVVAIPQDRIAPILAVLVVGVVAKLPNASPEEQCRVAIAAIAMVTVITGVALYAVGRLKLGNLLQYVPYPVIGGFLAGSGWLLTLGCFHIALGHALHPDNVLQLFTSAQLVKWLPAVVFGGLWFFLMKWSRHPMVPAGLLLAGVGLFYAMLHLTGVSLPEARTHGWLPTLLGAHGVAPFPSYLPFVGVPWATLGGEVNVVGTILLTSVVSVLLSASALELVSGQDVDINRELRSAGQASLLAGLGGGMVGFHSMSLSRLVLSMGAANRWVGVGAGLLCGAALCAGPALVSYIPQFICGGMLFFLGLMFLWEWVVEARHKLNLLDYLVVLLILGVIGALGYPQGVVTGVVAAIILFIHNYSRVDVVTHALSGEQLSSNVDRPLRAGRILRQQGDSICILKLQGFIFFGTASHVFDEIRERALAVDRPTLRFVVLDFRRVTGLDSSAVFSLRKAALLARKRGGLLASYRSRGWTNPWPFFKLAPSLSGGAPAKVPPTLFSADPLPIFW